MKDKLGSIIVDIQNEYRTSNKNRNRMIESLLWEFAKRIEKDFELKEK